MGQCGRTEHQDSFASLGDICGSSVLHDLQRWQEEGIAREDTLAKKTRRCEKRRAVKRKKRGGETLVVGSTLSGRAKKLDGTGRESPTRTSECNTGEDESSRWFNSRKTETIPVTDVTRVPVNVNLIFRDGVSGGVASGNKYT